MCYEVLVTPRFEKDAEYYFKKKKYTKVYSDITEIVNKLKQGIFIGDIIDNIPKKDNNDTYKVRSVNSSINVGTSNGFRLIYHVIKNDREVYLVTIYSKKDDKKVLSKKDIADLIDGLLEVNAEK